MSINKKINLFSVKYIAIIIALYLFINNPVLVSLGGIGTIKILYPIGFIYLIFYNKLSEIAKMFKKEIVFFILIILFSFIRAAFGGEMDYVRTFIIALIENIIIANFLAYILIRNPDSNWKTPVIHIGILGAIISTACFANPTINIFIKNLQVSNDFIFENNFRNFGLADGLTYSYGITQGVIFSLLLLNLKNNYKYLLFIPLFLISILFNARTGIFSVFFVLLYIIIVRKKFKTLIILFAIFFMSSLVLENSQLLVKNEQTVEWVTGFFKEINDLVTGSNTADYNTSQVLFEEMLVFPSNTTEWIVGSGVSSFGLQNKSTDIGFLLQLKYGGLVFTTLLLLLFLTMIKRLYFLKKYGWYLYLIIIATIISNLKGDFIPNSGGFRLLFLIYVIIIHIEKLIVKRNSQISFTNQSGLYTKIGV